MKRCEKIKIILSFFNFSLLLIIFDQLTKQLFTNKFYFENFFFSIKYSQNFGSAFSIFSGVHSYNFLLISLSIIVIINLSFIPLYFFRKHRFRRSNFICINLITILFISGIIGNLIDRIIYGYVRDFLSIKYLFVFNFADVYLFLGFILYLYYEYRKKYILKEE